MSEDLYIGIDPDLQRPALAVLRGQDVVFVACFKTGKSKRQEAVCEIAHESMHWMDLVADALAHEGFYPADVARIVVEAQEIYRGKTKNPQDILLLAAAAGAVLAAASTRWPLTPTAFALPKHWKKGVPKRIHQARVLSRLGIKHSLVGQKSTGYAVPDWQGKPPIGADKLNNGDWKHVVDAIGLAAYSQLQTD